MATCNAPNWGTNGIPRRSTRIFQIVPVTISSINGQGDPCTESTSTLAMNCHGCLYPSKKAYEPGSWITLEVQAQRSDGKPKSVRAQVRFIRPSRNAGDPYHVGVELQTPANIWGLPAPPADWFQFPAATSAAPAPSRSAPVPSGLALAPSQPSAVIARTDKPNGIALASAGASTATTLQMPSAGTSATARPSEASNGLAMRAAPEEIRRAFDAKLQQAAQKAVSLAVTSQVNTAIAEAIKAIAKFTETAVRDAERHCLIYRDKLVASTREQLAAPLSEARETTARLEGASSEVHLIMAEALDFLQESARQLEDQFSARLLESANRAAAGFGDKTAQFSERYLAGLAKQAQATTGEAMNRLETTAVEMKAQMDSVSLLAAQTRAECEVLRQASRDDLARATEQAVQHFRQRMEAVCNSSMVAAMSAVCEHSRSVIDALPAAPAGPLQEGGAEPSSV